MRARLAITAALALAGVLAAPGPAWADNEFGIPGDGQYPAPAVVVDPAAPPPPPAAPAPGLHHVRYTVTTDAPLFSRIYYHEVDPPTWSDYSHNPYEFTPRADADVAPDKPWVFDTSLADPGLWAMVVVQSGESPTFQTPTFRCQLEVDGAVVVTNSGPHGALCSLRKW